MEPKSKFVVYKVWMGRWVCKEDLEGLGLDKEYWKTSNSYVSQDEALHFTVLKRAMEALRWLQVSNFRLGLETNHFAVVKFRLTCHGFEEESRKDFPLKGNSSR